MGQIIFFLVIMVLIGSGAIGSDAFLLGLLIALVLIWTGVFLVYKNYNDKENDK